MGSRGPVPKRSDARRRRNEPEVPIDDTAPGADVVEIPEPSESWDPIARAIWESLATSGQSRYYEPSDWSTAYLMCESISRDLGEQVVGIVAQGPKAGEVVLGKIPLKGASLNAYRAVMASLLMTEGDRRRAALELQRTTPADPREEHEATVTQLHAIVSGTDG